MGLAIDEKQGNDLLMMCQVSVTLYTLHFKLPTSLAIFTSNAEHGSTSMLQSCVSAPWVMTLCHTHAVATSAHDLAHV